MENLDLYINDFPRRCFRDTADEDCIAARICYRATLLDNFHWSSLQCLEKYYKAIFLYSRVEAKNIGHSFSNALKKSEDLDFKIRFCDRSLAFLHHVDRFGSYRYLEASYYNFEFTITDLDRAVWELRRYCRVLKSNVGQVPETTLAQELNRIESVEAAAPQRFQIPGGFLEKVVQDKHHRARTGLIWKNLFFGKS